MATARRASIPGGVKSAARDTGTDLTSSRVTVAIGPHAPDSCGANLLRQVRDLADRSGARVVIHLAQSESEVQAVWQREGVEGASYLDRLGLLAPEAVVAHATYLSTVEAELVGRRATAVAHCPSSIAKLEARVCYDSENTFIQKSGSNWVVVARSTADFGPLTSLFKFPEWNGDAAKIQKLRSVVGAIAGGPIQQRINRWHRLDSNPDDPLWTDDFSNLLKIIGSLR